MENALEELRKQYTPLIVRPYFIFLTAFVVLFISYLLRGFVLSGEESYFYLRLSEIILGEGIPSYDFFSFGGRAFLYPLGSSMILVIFNFLFDISIENLIVFIPFILGFFNIVLLYSILRKFKLSKNILSSVCYIFLLSPAFLYISNYFTYVTIPLFLNLMAFYFILSGKKILRFFSFLIYLLLPFFGFIHVFFGMIVLYFYFKKFQKISNFIPYLFILLITFVLNFNFISKFGFGVVGYDPKNLIFDISGSYGFSIFLIILIFFGMMFVWKSGKYKNNFLYLFILLNLLMVFLNFKYIIYTTLIFSVVAAFGLKNIYKIKWSSILIRNLILIILILGIIFSGFSFINENSEVVPDEEFKEVLNILNDKTFPREVILSHEDYGIYINTISKRKNFIDFNYEYAPRFSDRIFFLDKIFYSRDLGLVLGIFDEFNVKYILITPEMKNGLVWSRNDEGLLYLLNNNPNYFKLIYDKNDFEIWVIR